MLPRYAAIGAQDSRVDRYISALSPTGCASCGSAGMFAAHLPVMVAAFLINTMLSLAGIVLFSMRVYDRVIPAQSYLPTVRALLRRAGSGAVRFFCCVKRVRTYGRARYSAPICAFPIGYSVMR